MTAAAGGGGWLALPRGFPRFCGKLGAESGMAGDAESNQGIAGIAAGMARGATVRAIVVGAYFGVGYPGIALACRRARTHLKGDRFLAERIRAAGINS